MANDAFQLQGLDGGVVISDGQTWTAAAGGGARWVQFAADTVLASYAGNLRDGETWLGGYTHAQGTGFGGNTTALAVTSGVVIIYEFGGEGTVV